MTKLNINTFSFRAMASPCELRVQSDNHGLLDRLGNIVQTEARRIEAKYSRYKNETIISRINSANGKTVQVDSETAQLLDYAQHCFELSEQQFDITSGILRGAWKFDGSDNVPTQRDINKLLPLVGWGDVIWENPYLTLKPGMEIDFGGIGKEYAVDRALLAAVTETNLPVLVNFGGDLRVSGPLQDKTPWQITLQSVDVQNKKQGVLALMDGALATSGDAQRFLVKDGKRYGHILDPLTGWPIENPPRSVTVSAPTCMEAGILSTLAMLQGSGAENFLASEKINAWCIR